MIERSGEKDILSDPTPTRTAALMGRSIQFLRETGIWDSIETKCHPMRALSITDWSRTPHQTQHFEAKEIGHATFGLNCPIGPVRHALIKQAKKTKNLTCLFGVQLDTLTQQPGFVSLSLTGKKKPLKAALVIGADGRNSAIRELAYIPFKRKDYVESAVTCIFEHGLPHHDISYENHWPGGPATTVPLPGQTSSLVWVMPTQDVEDVIHFKKHEMEAVINHKIGNRLGEITLMTGLESFPLCTMRVERLTTHRVALMAEAAHGFSPIGAQGLNLSLRDALVLRNTILSARRNGLDIGSQNALIDYERQMQGDIHPRTIAVDLLHRSVAAPLPSPIHSLRREGMRLAGRSAILRRLIMRAGFAA